MPPLARSDQRLRPVDPEHDQRGDTMPAGKVFVVMVGVLSLAALFNAEAMLQRVETSELGRGRDVALWFWRPVEAVSTPLGFGMPRSGVEALRGTPGPDPGQTVAGSDPESSEQAAEARGPVGGSGQLGHEPFIPDPAAPTTIPGTGGPTTTPLDPPGSLPGIEPGADRPSTATPLGLPPPQPQPDPPAATAPAEPLSTPVTDGTGTAPTSTTPEPAPPGSVFPLRRPTVEDPLRILIIGDSTMDAVGNSMLRDLSNTGVATAELDYRISTGLSRPDFFDWPGHLREARAAGQIEVVVIMIGANDAQPFLIDDQPEAHGTELWFATYRHRVAALLDELTADGGWVLWIGQPVMRSEDYSAKMQQLNQIYAEEISRYPTAIYIDSRSVMSDGSGVYTAYLVDGGGTRQLVRQGDGVHLTSAGGDRLSPLIVEELNRIAPLY
ncbi:MAG: DUF459 domain-containing protein [Acidimicrobiia bacterium]|nr:DUF459 domain-containing protein [Acidimicrobiia bacterium]